MNDRTNSSLSPQARKAAEAQAAVQNGSAITLLERLTNERSQTATNVVVSGSLPQGAQVTGCDTGSGGGSCIMQGNNVSARYPTFGPGQTAPINITATVPSGPGTYSSGVVSDSGNIDFSTGAFSARYLGYTTLVSPANGATIATSQPLVWNAADGANLDGVYFGTTNPPPLVGAPTYVLVYRLKPPTSRI